VSKLYSSGFFIEDEAGRLNGELRSMLREEAVEKVMEKPHLPGLSDGDVVVRIPRQTNDKSLLQQEIQSTTRDNLRGLSSFFLTDAARGGRFARTAPRSEYDLDAIESRLDSVLHNATENALRNQGMESMTGTLTTEKDVEEKLLIAFRGNDPVAAKEARETLRNDGLINDNLEQLAERHYDVVSSTVMATLEQNRKTSPELIPSENVKTDRSPEALLEDLKSVFLQVPDNESEISSGASGRLRADGILTEASEKNLQQALGGVLEGEASRLAHKNLAERISQVESQHVREQLLEKTEISGRIFETGTGLSAINKVLEDKKAMAAHMTALPTAKRDMPEVDSKEPFTIALLETASQREPYHALSPERQKELLQDIQKSLNEGKSPEGYSSAIVVRGGLQEAANIASKEGWEKDHGVRIHGAQGNEQLRGWDAGDLFVTFMAGSDKGRTHIVEPGLEKPVEIGQAIEQKTKTHGLFLLKDGPLAGLRIRPEHKFDMSDTTKWEKVATFGPRWNEQHISSIVSEDRWWDKELAEMSVHVEADRLRTVGLGDRITKFQMTAEGEKLDQRFIIKGERAQEIRSFPIKDGNIENHLFTETVSGTTNWAATLSAKPDSDELSREFLPRKTVQKAVPDTEEVQKSQMIGVNKLTAGTIYQMASRVPLLQTQKGWHSDIETYQVVGKGKRELLALPVSETEIFAEAKVQGFEQDKQHWAEIKEKGTTDIVTTAAFMGRNAKTGIHRGHAQVYLTGEPVEGKETKTILPVEASFDRKRILDPFGITGKQPQDIRKDRIMYLAIEKMLDGELAKIPESEHSTAATQDRLAI